MKKTVVEGTEQRKTQKLVKLFLFLCITVSKFLIALLFKSYTKDQEINDKSEATIFFRFFCKCYLFRFLRHQLFVYPA